MLLAHSCTSTESLYTVQPHNNNSIYLIIYSENKMNWEANVV